MTRPVVWIAGGTDKGNDYSRLYDLAGAKVKALVCMGRRQREADPCLRRAHSPHRRHALARRRDGCGAGCGFLRRYGAAFAGLRELRPVQELRGTGASVQGVGGDALAEAPLTTAVPGLVFRRREGRRDEMSGSCGRGEFPASGASRRSRTGCGPEKRYPGARLAVVRIHPGRFSVRMGAAALPGTRTRNY